MANTLTLTMATVEGRLAPTDQQKDTIRNFIVGMEGKPVQVKFSKPHQVRSLKQNKFYWAVVLQTISSEVGHTPEELHYFCKEQFLGRKFIKLGGKEVEIRKTTTDLSIHEFIEYINKVMAWASTELGIVIPDSDV